MTFIKKMFTKNNWVVLVFCLLNIVVGGILLALIPEIPVVFFNVVLKEQIEFSFIGALWKTMIASMVLFILALLVNLSPVGEFINRKRYRAKKVENADSLSQLEKMYVEVLERVNALNANIGKHIRIYMTESPETTVTATGKNSLVVTTGILSFPEEKTKTLMARELGHISEGDTVFLALLHSGNAVVNLCIWVFFICIMVLSMGIQAFLAAIWVAIAVTGFVCVVIPPTQVLAVLLKSLAGLIWKLMQGLFKLIVWVKNNLIAVWSRIGVKMVLATRKSAEYDADEFAFNCGYGETLYDIIVNDNLADQSEGIFKDIILAYPSADSRIAKLQALGLDTSQIRFAETVEAVETISGETEEAATEAVVETE